MGVRGKLSNHGILPPELATTTLLSSSSNHSISTRSHPCKLCFKQSYLMTRLHTYMRNLTLELIFFSPSPTAKSLIQVCPGSLPQDPAQQSSPACRSRFSHSSLASALPAEGFQRFLVCSHQQLLDTLVHNPGGQHVQLVQLPDKPVQE